MSLKKWDINLTYGLKSYTLKAEQEYCSNQIMRIRVFGKFSTLLLENNFPYLQLTNSKKGIKWKLKEGKLLDNGAKSAQLFSRILTELEYKLKQK